ncbi:DBH-like monooxygenase protein 2 homolog [Lineus longissimus]|uniref:DBH-like monooxygenase protein 2 homolog n=1 Tax=Lineus longissimus TaxID=88925 RepID=UPI002B4EB771
MLLLSSVMVCLVVLRAQAMPSPSRPYPNQKIMDSNGNYHLYWLYDHTSITFEIIAKTTGYIGLGWSPKGGMANGDIIISGVYANGTDYFKDCHGLHINAKPVCHETQDVLPIMSQEIAGYTRVKFRRQLDTCKMHDLPVTSGTMRMIWSMGKTDVMDWHGSNRGTRSLKLLGDKQVEVKLPPDVKTFDIVKDNFLVPDTETHYDCEIFRLPKLEDIHHVIKVIPVITHPELVHHIIVYVCDAKINTWANMTYQVNNGSQCLYKNSAMWSHGYCETAMFGWAVGGGNFTFPNNTGVPMGTDREPFYVMLQIHYNNIKRTKNVRDNSGVRIVYTKTKRQHDTGCLVFGKISFERLMVPPRQSKFTVYSYIPRTCTGEFGFGNQTQIRAFAYLLHSHYAGSAIRLRHFRNGRELEYLGDDPTYDFNYQNSITYPQEIVIERGDEFLVECTYNTLDRTHTTLGGLSSQEEMCLTFLYFYPRIPLSKVITATSYSAQSNFYVNNRKDDRTSTTRRDFLASNIRWDKTTSKDPVKEWQQIEKAQENYIALCTASKGLGVVDKWIYNLNPFKIYSEYKPPTLRCNITASANVALPCHLIIMNLATLVLLLAEIV